MAAIRLDLEALVEDGHLSAHEAARLRLLAPPERRGHLAVNLLMVFGALSAALAAVAMVADAVTGLALALLALAGSELLRRHPQGSFSVLASAFALMGTLGLAAWAVWEMAHSSPGDAALLVTFILTAGAIRYASAFLSALAVLSLGAAFGADTRYWHASYALFIEAPTVTIAVFGLLATGLWQLHGRIGPAWRGAVTSAARTSLLLVHFAFWIGALWGDRIGGAPAWSEGEAAAAGLAVSRWVFAGGWALIAIALAVLARRGGFISVSALVFLGIHFYTQYFELLGANPASLLAAGLILLGLAVSVNWLVRRARTPGPAAHHTPSDG
jgi:iron complex transport system permease protein